MHRRALRRVSSDRSRPRRGDRRRRRRRSSKTSPFFRDSTRSGARARCRPRGAPPPPNAKRSASRPRRHPPAPPRRARGRRARRARRARPTRSRRSRARPACADAARATPGAFAKCAPRATRRRMAIRRRARRRARTPTRPPIAPGRRRRSIAARLLRHSLLPKEWFRLRVNAVSSSAPAPPQPPARR